MERRGMIPYELFKIMMIEEDIDKIKSSSIKLQKIKKTA